jgi:hypothetical protein
MKSLTNIQNLNSLYQPYPSSRKNGPGRYKASAADGYAEASAAGYKPEEEWVLVRPRRRRWLLEGRGLWRCRTLCPAY